MESKYPDVSASWTEMNKFYTDIYSVLNATPLTELLNDPEFHARVLPAIEGGSKIHNLLQEKVREELHPMLSTLQFIPRWESYMFTLVWNADLEYRTNKPISNYSFTKGEFVDLLALEPFLKVALHQAGPDKRSFSGFNYRSRFILKAKSHTATIQYGGENNSWTYSVARLGSVNVKNYPAGSYAEALDLIEITIRLTRVNQDINNPSDVITQLREMEEISNASNVLIRIATEGETNPVFRELVNAIRDLGALRRDY